MSAAEYYSSTAFPPAIITSVPPPAPTDNFPPTPPATGSSSPRPFFTPQSVVGPPPQTQPESRPLNATRTPSPLHRPISRPYSAYSASRPRPRPGLVRRVRTRISALLRLLYKVAKEHPLRTGLLALVPVGILGIGERMWERGEKWLEENAKGKGAYGGVLDEFVGFGGSREGPLDGALKVVHMLVNHLCKLTPHALPRILSILLELYFLKDMVMQVARK